MAAAVGGRGAWPTDRVWQRRSRGSGDGGRRTAGRPCHTGSPTHSTSEVFPWNTPWWGSELMVRWSGVEVGECGKVCGRGGRVLWRATAEALCEGHCPLHTRQPSGGGSQRSAQRRPHAASLHCTAPLLLPLIQHRSSTPPAARAFICLKLPLSTVLWLAWRPRRPERQQDGAERRPGRPQASAVVRPCCKRRRRHQRCRCRPPQQLHLQSPRPSDAPA